MKNLFVLMAVASLITVASGCTKTERCQEKTIESEEAAMLNYANVNGIGPVVKHSSGMYYYIENAGNATKPEITSTVSAKYIGKRLDNTIFDQRPTTPVTFYLGETIFGWQLGLPLIGEGGIIHLIIPSSLAYGCTGKAPIEPYSILYFRVELVDVL